MAIAIRGTTPATDVSFGADATMTVTLTGARQPQAGDLLVIGHTNDWFDASNMPTPTVGGSTTGVTSIVNADGGSLGPHTKSWYYVVPSTGDLTVAVTETGTADEEKAFVVYVLSGTDTASPLDGTPVSGFSTSSTSTRVMSAITTSNTDSMLIAVIGPGSTTTNNGFTPPSSPWVEDADLDITASNNYWATCGHEQLSASGSTGTRTFTVASGSSEWSGVMFAIKAGSGAPPPGPPPAPTVFWPNLTSRLGGRWPRQQESLGDQAAPSAATNAPATEATATGTAFFDGSGGSISLNLISDSPVEAVGTAYNPTVSTANATNAAAQLATGTGTANNPQIKIEPVPTAASGTGTANNTTSKVSPTPGTATATGSAFDATVSTTGGTNAAAGLASATGAANNASASIAPTPTAATATGAAQGATGKVSPTPTTATATGTAYNPTVQTGSFTNAQAATANATGTANTTTGKVATGSQAATGAGTANDPSPSIPAHPTTATATGTAFNASVTRSANAQAGLAAATGAISAVSLRILATAEAAAGLAVALNADITGGEVAARSVSAVTDRRRSTPNVTARATSTSTTT